MTNPVVLIASLSLLGILNLITVAAQTALLHASLPRLITQQEQGGKRSDTTTALLQSPARAQASLNLMRLILRFAIAGVILLFVIGKTDPANLLVGFGVLLLAALTVFAVEWMVEGVVLQDTTAWILRLTGYIQVVTAVLSPGIGLTQLLFGARQSPLGVSDLISVTEADLRSLVDAGPTEGQLEQGERKMIHSIFELGSTLAREIMVPRIDMLVLDVQTPFPEAVDTLLKSGHSRVPVYEETVDNILGLLYAKDLLKVWREGSQLESLRSLLRPAYFIPEAKKVDELLAEMQSRRIHMAVVVDEYGGVAGIVTLEDIVEEILGEILDEYDQAEELPYEEVGENEYIFQGRIDLDDFNEVTNQHLPKDEADTLAGFIYSRMGRVPSNGESLQVDALVLTVEQVSGRRIRKVRAQAALSTPPEDERVSNVND